jgi:hypothetical protein
MKYFITYVYSRNDGWGYGSAMVNVKNGLMTKETIESFTNDMTSQLNADKVVVINWNKLDDEGVDDE